MNRRILMAASLLVAFALSGCTNTPKLVRALSKDPAAVHLSVKTMWASVELTRVGARTNDTVVVAPDGTVEIKAR